MRADSLQMAPGFREKLMDRVKAFIRRHRRMKIPAMLYALVVLVFYNIGNYFVRNTKRFACLASILLFFAASSSFSYPTALKLNISFVATGMERSVQTAETDIELKQEEAATVSDAELAEVRDVDETVVEDAVETSSDEGGELADGYETVTLQDIIEANKDIAYEEESEVERESDNVTFDRGDWKLILVNKQHPIPEGYEFPLGNITSKKKCDQRILTALASMLKAAADDDTPLEIASPYRSDDRQETIFNQHIDNYMRAGMSYMDAYNITSQAVTVPGSSEHQIGLALDLVQNDHYVLDEAFGETKGGKWLRDNSYKYGFILRYPRGKEYITGIEYEPWHFRYVGVEAATVMYEEDLCLEEFWSQYLYE